MRFATFSFVCAGCAVVSQGLLLSGSLGPSVHKVGAGLGKSVTVISCRRGTPAVRGDPGRRMSMSISRRELLQRGGLGLASLVAGAAGRPAGAGAVGGVDAVRARFGDKLRRAAKMLDELQEDIFNKDWDLVATYPNAFRSLVPIFTKYTDAAFATDSPVDVNTRVALRYEVGRLFGAVERLKRATDEQNEREAQRAFAAMSVAYDRYLKAGNLYDAYDPITSTEGFYSGLGDSALKYASPAKDPPRIKDSILLITGPDKGKTGRMIGVEAPDRSRPQGQGKAIVKLENGSSLGGIREIKVVPLDYVAKTLDQPDMSSRSK